MSPACNEPPNRSHVEDSWYLQSSCDCRQHAIDWRHRLVSVFAGTSKALRAFVMEDCLGPSKWIWFSRQQKPLDHLDHIDSGNRGPLGSLKLLIVTFHGSFFYYFGAMSVTLSVAIHPFAVGKKVEVRYRDDATTLIAYGKRYSRGTFAPISARRCKFSAPLCQSTFMLATSEVEAGNGNTYVATRTGADLRYGNQPFSTTSLPPTPPKRTSPPDSAASHHPRPRQRKMALLKPPALKQTQLRHLRLPPRLFAVIGIKNTDSEKKNHPLRPHSAGSRLVRMTKGSVSEPLRKVWHRPGPMVTLWPAGMSLFSPSTVARMTPEWLRKVSVWCLGQLSGRHVDGGAGCDMGCRAEFRRGVGWGRIGCCWRPFPVVRGVEIAVTVTVLGDGAGEEGERGAGWWRD